MKISSGDLFGDTEVARQFEIKLGGLLSMAHLVLGHHEGAWDDSEKYGLKPFLVKDNFKDQSEYQNFETSQSQKLVAYLRLFAYRGDQKGIVPGWLYQVHGSLHGATDLFNKDVAFPSTRENAMVVNLGGLFTETSLNWEENKGLFGIGKIEKSYHKLVEEMRKHTEVAGIGLDKFLNQFYVSIVRLEEKK